MDARLEPLIRRPPAWLMPGGPDGDVVVATRVRLARNIQGRSFPDRMAAESAREIVDLAKDRLTPLFEDGLILEPNGLSRADTDLLVERSLATRNLVQVSRPTVVFSNNEESLGVLVNEEDHFRVQSFSAGLNFGVAFQMIRPLMRRVGDRFPLARSTRYGFLTSCPSNVGTGLRASLLLHLPALARNRTALQKTLQAAQRMNLAVRGVHGEGSRALGDLYQISNQRTLGGNVMGQIQQVEEFGREVAGYERQTRQSLVAHEAGCRNLQADVLRCYDDLVAAEGLTTGQALGALSTLRLACLAEVLEEKGVHLEEHDLLLNSFQIQPGHLQARVGSELPPEQRDASRAELLRSALSLN